MKLVLKNALLYSVFLILDIASGVRVCKTFKDYYLPLITNCFNSDLPSKNTTEIIQSWGFDVEEHYLKTKDGFNILVNRMLPRGVQNPKPVILAHGIFMNSRSYVNEGNNSLPLILANSGFEIWLVNFRGTLYSRNNDFFDSSQLQFWQYSFHQMGSEDLRIITNYVFEKTKQKSYYVGFSMGTTASFVYTTLYPEEAKKNLEALINMAPIVYFENIKSILAPLSMFWPLVKNIVATILHGEVVLSNDLAAAFCSFLPINAYACHVVRGLIFGIDLNQLNPETFPVEFYMNQDSVAIGVIEHYYQLLKTGRFQQQDFGTEENMNLYNQSNPPLYELRKVPVPVVLFAGKNDYLASVENANRTMNELAEENRCGVHIVEYPHWAHADFVIGKDRYPYLYQPLLQVLDRMKKGKC